MGGISKLDGSLKIDVMLFELDRDFRISFFSRFSLFSILSRLIYLRN